MLMWTVVACLCFVGIPFHLKGKDPEEIEAAFKNYSELYNKSYDEEERVMRFNIFKKSLLKANELNEQDDENILASVAKPNLKSAGGDGDSEDVNNEWRNVKHALHQYVSHKKWKHGTPKNQGYAVYGVTEFSDMSNEEFRRAYLRPDINDKIKTRERHHNHIPHPDSHHHHHHHEGDEVDVIDVAENTVMRRRKRRALSFTGSLPDKVDWRTKGAVTPILHQKSCGACWAFSTVATVESMKAIQTGKLEALSVQYVIDCATNGNMGCNGGDTCGALSWMQDQKLIPPASQYPLTLEEGKCKLKQSKSGVQISPNYTCDSYVGAEENLLSVLAHHGPVAAAVDATNWQYYVGGVIQWNCDSNNNHAVQIVGYDKTATPPHYIVRNSWGTDFGDNGFLYIAIGSDLCGITKEVSSLTVEL